MIYIILVLIAGALNLFAIKYNRKMKQILELKGYKITWNFNEYAAFKNVIQKEENINDKNYYKSLAKKYIILTRLIRVLVITFAVILLFFHNTFK